MSKLPASQNGFALLVALMFLIIVTLLSVSALRSSTMELRMSGNEQEYRIGFDSTQSAADVLRSSTQLAVTNSGDVSCYGFGAAPACNGAVANIDLGANNAGTNTNNIVRATLANISTTCPYSAGNSAAITANRHGSGRCAYFTIESTYDATSQRGSRVDTQSGFVKVIN